jgi:hypothetical protein
VIAVVGVFDAGPAGLTGLSEQDAAAYNTAADNTPTGHTLTVTLDGDHLRCRVVCHEPEGAGCRLSCDNDGCADDDICNDRGETCHLSDGGDCEPALYLNEDPCLILEWHEAVTEPLTDGMPIVCTWDGDGYTWRGAHTPAAGTVRASGAGR